MNVAQCNHLLLIKIGETREIKKIKFDRAKLHNKTSFEKMKKR